MEQDEQWSTGKRYFDMTAYWQWRAAQSSQAVPAATSSLEGGHSQTTY
jgi:hypothetical protein